jgi:hypothetical protein
MVIVPLSVHAPQMVFPRQWLLFKAQAFQERVNPFRSAIAYSAVVILPLFIKAQRIVGMGKAGIQFQHPAYFIRAQVDPGCHLLGKMLSGDKRLQPTGVDAGCQLIQI